MPTLPDNGTERWLRYAPWAAAILVVLCFVALIARVASQAGVGANPRESTETQVSPQSGGAPSQGNHGIPSVAVAPGGTSERSDADVAIPLTSEPTGPRIARSPRHGALKSVEPPSPSSNSRFESYGPRRGSLSADFAKSANGQSRAEALRSSGPTDRQAKSSLDTAPSVLGGRANGPLSPAGLAQTSVFGIEATGRRFVYVFDRSGSMGQPENKPLRAAKEELLASLQRLDSIHQFFLIFYNQEPLVFNPSGVRGRLVFADDLNKRSAHSFIDGVSAQGGTKHYDALLIAVRLHPDVVFLLTDGESKDDLSAAELAHLKRLNDGIAQIHVVQFASSPYASNSLVQLAKENGGQHTYIDIRKLLDHTEAKR